MKGLVVSLPLRGHMTPLLPLIRELVARGDDLVVYSTPAFADSVSATGARFRPYEPGPLDSLARLPERTEELSSLLMGLVRDLLAADLPGMRDERPDYVVTDSVAPWGQWVARLLNVPVVTSITTFAVNRHVMAFAAAHGVRPKSVRLALAKLQHISKAFLSRRRLTRQYRVSGPGVFKTVFGSSELNIVYTSREFQPCGETFDTTFHFVGAAVDPSREPGSGPAGGPGTTGANPVVYISLGTLFNTDVAFYRRCCEAFRDEPLEVVMAIGSQVSGRELGVLPGNVTVAAFVPQLEVLARASAFITHGGMNSVGESLRMGVPMVTVPQMGEQAIVSRRVEQLGAGIFLSKNEASPERLRSSVRRLLAEPRFRQTAGRLGETLLGAGGVAKAADLVQHFAAKQTPNRFS